MCTTIAISIRCALPHHLLALVVSHSGPWPCLQKWEEERANAPEAAPEAAPETALVLTVQPQLQAPMAAPTQAAVNQVSARSTRTG